MHYLCAKEAEAWRADKDDEAMSRLGQQRSFMADHVLPWIPGYCDQMEKEAALDFYRGIARVVKGFLAADRERLAALTA